MMMIVLMGIINAAWGSGELKGTWLGKWTCGLAVFFAVFSHTLSFEYSILWAAGFLIFRAPSLSKNGFKAFNGTTYEKIDAFFYLAVRSLLLVPAMFLLAIKNYQVIYLMPLTMIYGFIYSAIGRYVRNKSYAPRLAEYLSGDWIGVIILMSWEILNHQL